MWILFKQRTVSRCIHWLLEYQVEKVELVLPEPPPRTKEYKYVWQHGSFNLEGGYTRDSLRYAELYVGDTLVAEWNYDTLVEYHSGAWEQAFIQTVRGVQRAAKAERMRQRKARFVPFDDMRKED